MQNRFAYNARKVFSQIGDYFSSRDLVKNERYILHLKGEFNPDFPFLKLISCETEKYCKKLSFLLGKLPNVLDLVWLLLANHFDLDTNTTLAGLLPIEFSRAMTRSIIKTRQASQESGLVKRANFRLMEEEITSVNGEFGYGGDFWKGGKEDPK